MFSESDTDGGLDGYEAETLSLSPRLTTRLKMPHWISTRVRCVERQERGRLMIDLHTHTTASHGRRTPAEAIQEAYRLGLDALAITDHNTIDGLDEAREALQGSRLTLVPGAEFSVDYKGWEIHMLGLFVDDQDARFRQEMDRVIDLWTDRLKAKCEKLQGLGMEVRYEELEYSGRFPVVVSSIASVMVRKGYVKTGEEAFERYLNEGLPAYVPSLVSVEEAGAIVHQAGGLYVVAHPNYGEPFGDIDEKVLSDLKERGADGVEAFYRGMPKDVTERYISMARRLDMVVTAGSDCHGDCMGVISHPDWVWLELLHALRKRRG